MYNGLATPDRDRLDLDGLLPAGDASPELEVDRASAAVDACESPMQKYRQLVTLQNTDERAFYALLERRTAELLPILYTPTVGDACLQFGTLTPRPPGLYVSLNDLGAVDRVVARWPSPDVRVAVLTDGERILGLGDQGANGMGISAGKSMVYAACGVNPSWLLPVHVDNGTNNQRLLDDPLYVGLRRRRVRGDAYDRLLDETVAAIRARYGDRTLAHWEDLAPRNAFEVLRRFQDPEARRADVQRRHPGHGGGDGGGFDRERPGDAKDASRDESFVFRRGTGEPRRGGALGEGGDGGGRERERGAREHLALRQPRPRGREPPA